MHKSAMFRMEWFVNNYVPKDKEVKVLDVGSYDVNGSYRRLFGNNVKYTGLDMSSGKNVHIVPKDIYSWTEIEDNTYDVVISGNAFEHIEYPWVTIKEIYRVLKPEGFACILTPFALKEHRYPTDCYRYYADGLKALAKWGGFKVVEATVGGVPIDADPKSQWFSRVENYDDSMIVMCKTDDETKLAKLPRFNRTNLIHEWNN